MDGPGNVTHSLSFNPHDSHKKEKFGLDTNCIITHRAHSIKSLVLTTSLGRRYHYFGTYSKELASNLKDAET